MKNSSGIRKIFRIPKIGSFFCILIKKNEENICLRIEFTTEEIDFFFLSLSGVMMKFLYFSFSIVIMF